MSESPTSEGFPSTPEQMPEPDEPPHFAQYHHDPNPMLRFPDGSGDAWEPGEPMYGNRRGNYVRRLFQILSDLPVTTYSEMFWCAQCDVLWVEKYVAESPCWACGTTAPNPDSEPEIERRKRHRERVSL